MTTFVRSSLLALLLIGISSLGLAQNRQQPNRPQSPADLPPVTVDGPIESVKDSPQGPVLTVKVPTGHTYHILIMPRESKLGLTGTAKPDFLKPGMLVSFTTIMPKEKDKKAEIDSPPTELRIISPSETNVQGLFENKDKDDEFYIVATVRSYKDGKLTVGAAGKTITVPVASDLDIKVQSTDPAFIRVGDTVKIRAGQVRAPKTEGNNVIDGQAIGREVDVTLQDTLTASTFKKKK